MTTKFVFPGTNINSKEYDLDIIPRIGETVIFESPSGTEDEYRVHHVSLCLFQTESSWYVVMR